MLRVAVAVVPIGVGILAASIGNAVARADADPRPLVTATCSAYPGSTITNWSKGKVTAVEFVWKDAYGAVLDDVVDTTLKTHEASEPTPPGAVEATLTYFDAHGEVFLGGFIPSCR